MLSKLLSFFGFKSKSDLPAATTVNPCSSCKNVCSFCEPAETPVPAAQVMPTVVEIAAPSTAAVHYKSEEPHVVDEEHEANAMLVTVELAEEAKTRKAPAKKAAKKAPAAKAPAVKTTAKKAPAKKAPAKKTEDKKPPAKKTTKK
jgi:hypothetical protein